MTNSTAWHVWQGIDLKVRVTRTADLSDTAEVLDGDFNVLYTRNCDVQTDDYANALASAVWVLRQAISGDTLTPRQLASAKAGVDRLEAVLAKTGEYDLVLR